MEGQSPDWHCEGAAGFASGIAALENPYRENGDAP